ncbi:MAG TPA: FtsX-like permease family protein, partial [Sediminibacterium sp.]|nr:FtsX-like permease family protein [Sediminibacterium sp.]
GGQTISLRKALVVMQFGISILLIITTMVVFQQLNYLEKTDMGYNKDQIVILPYYFTSNSQYEAFRSDMLQHAVIAGMGRSSRVPTGRLLDSQNASAESGDSLRPINSELKYLAADYDFIPSYGIQMAAGRNFSRSFGTDTAGFVINEATVEVLGWKNAQQAIGRNFMYGDVKGKVIGVVKNFHFESLHQRIVPLVMCLPRADQNNFYNQLSVKVSGKDMPAALAALEAGWHHFLPEMPFDYTFLDNRFQQLYVSEQRQRNLFSLFAGIAIVIACLGLLGLSSFSITQRFKEIGIRKVLGANVSGIVLLLSKDFLLLVMIAALVAFPIAWYAMQSWLGEFAYRITLQWWVFIAAGLLAAAVALLTVSVQAIQAATSNPIKSLRTE